MCFFSSAVRGGFCCCCFVFLFKKKNFVFFSCQVRNCRGRWLHVVGKTKQKKNASRVPIYKPNSAPPPVPFAFSSSSSSSSSSSCLFVLFFFKYILFIIYLRFVRQHLRCHHRPSFLVFLLRLLLLLLLLLFCLFFFRSFFFFGFFLSVTVDNYESILYGDGGRRYGWKEKPQLENEKDKKKKKQIFIEK